MCPVRILVALASVLLLAWVLLSSSASADSWPAGLLGRAADKRSWWRFVSMLFTGELIYAYLSSRGGGGPVDGAADDAAAGGDQAGAARAKAD